MRAKTAPKFGFRIARQFAPYRCRLLLSLLLVLTAVALSSTGPLLLQKVLNDALPHHRTRLLSELCVAMLISAILATAVTIGQGMAANSIGQRVVHDLRLQVYARVQAMPLNFFTLDANTEIQARLVSDLGGINEILTYTVQSVVAAGISLITAAVVMLILSWPLAVASIVLALGLNVLNQRFSKRRRQLAKQNQELVASMLKLVAEDLSLPGIVLGRTLGRAQSQHARFEDLSGQIRNVTYHQRLAGRTSLAVITLTMASLPPLVYWLSGTVLPGISLGTAVVIATMQVRLAGPIQQLLALNGSWQASRAMFERVFEYIDLHGADEGSSADPSVPLPADVPCLTLRGLGYQYPDSDRQAISGLDAEFRPRSLTIVAGPSGCGKSTTALLVSGLIAADSGEILLDGAPASTRQLRDTVTLVPQDCFLFNASLRENLLFAAPEATPAELHQAVAAARLLALIERLPDGLDTPVGERGFQLSGGERQRVAFARALLSDHRILVVDEATSALDGTTANEIYEGLRSWSADKTVIVIAHRIPRARAEDRVLVMDGGQVVERGCHGEVLAQEGAYHSLVAKQSLLTGA